MVALSKREKERRRRDIVWIVLVMLLLLGVVVSIALYVFTRPPGIDEASLCPTTGPKGHYVLLVDRTDPLTFTQREALNVTLNELVEKRIPQGYLLSVFVLGEDFRATAKPLVELCNPGSGEDKSEFTNNLRRLKKQYQVQFLDPVRQQLESFSSAKPAKYSPIFEMMQLVAVNGFKTHAVEGERRLVVVSDMLQNTPQFSMYKEPVDYSSFAASTYGQKAQLELGGVEVEIHYLMNTPQLQTKRNVKFWEDYFEYAGARVVAVRPL